jgi:hypothetical protein
MRICAGERARLEVNASSKSSLVRLVFLAHARSRARAILRKKKVSPLLGHSNEYSHSNVSNKHTLTADLSLDFYVSSKHTLTAALILLVRNKLG